ncbi:histone-lysine N-methyltransferase SETMAR [Plakobranchus ocellatus]|uniref:Histone-lysine N-methyltransferase SETMAR n=1 Tax=Plakobranchus ocellatus TaxID=259542 RepID=A0AAV3XWY1_9GAST|nr:histone-lysine N-methyltransferase SETMAR [Plakobranchus ocellatus]
MFSDGDMAEFCKNTMAFLRTDGLISLSLLLCCLFTAGGATCTFPSALTGTWVLSESSQPTKTFTSSQVSPFTVTTQSTTYSNLVFDCFINTGDLYVMKTSTSISILTVSFEVYFCWSLSAQTSNKFLYYSATDENHVASNARVKILPTTTSVTDYTTICDSTSFSQGEFRVMIKQGTASSERITCPEPLLATGTYTMTDTSNTVYCDGGTSSLDGCTSWATLTANLTACSTQIFYSAGGQVYCMYQEDFSSTNSSTNTYYVSLFNTDSTVDSSSTHFFTCVVVYSASDNTSIAMSTYPNYCFNTTYQNATYISQSGGFTIDMTASISSSSLSVGVIIAIVIACLLFIALIILVAFLIYNYVYLKKQNRPSSKIVPDTLPNTAMSQADKNKRMMFTPAPPKSAGPGGREGDYYDGSRAGSELSLHPTVSQLANYRTPTPFISDSKNKIEEGEILAEIGDCATTQQGEQPMTSPDSQGENSAAGPASVIVVSENKTQSAEEAAPKNSMNFQKDQSAKTQLIPSSESQSSLPEADQTGGHVTACEAAAVAAVAPALLKQNDSGKSKGKLLRDDIARKSDSIDVSTARGGQIENGACKDYSVAGQYKSVSRALVGRGVYATAAAVLLPGTSSHTDEGSRNAEDIPRKRFSTYTIVDSPSKCSGKTDHSDAKRGPLNADKYDQISVSNDITSETKEKIKTNLSCESQTQLNTQRISIRREEESNAKAQDAEKSKPRVGNDEENSESLGETEILNADTGQININAAEALDAGLIISNEIPATPPNTARGDTMDEESSHSSKPTTPETPKRSPEAAAKRPRPSRLSSANPSVMKKGDSRASNIAKVSEPEKTKKEKLTTKTPKSAKSKRKNGEKPASSIASKNETEPGGMLTQINDNKKPNPNPNRPITRKRPASTTTIISHTSSITSNTQHPKSNNGNTATETNSKSRSSASNSKDSGAQQTSISKTTEPQTNISKRPKTPAEVKDTPPNPTRSASRISRAPSRVRSAAPKNKHRDPRDDTNPFVDRRAATSTPAAIVRPDDIARIKSAANKRLVHDYKIRTMRAPTPSETPKRAQQKEARKMLPAFILPDTNSVFPAQTQLQDAWLGGNTDQVAYGTTTYHAGNGQQKHGEGALSRSRVYQWCTWFGEGRTSLGDEPKSGRPKTSTNEENTTRVDELIRCDRRMKIREFALKFEIPKNTVHEIVHDTLGYRKVSARWVPKMLTEDHKLQRVEISQRLLQRYQQDNGDEDTTHIGVEPGGDFQANNNLFDNLITGDETWDMDVDSILDYDMKRMGEPDGAESGVMIDMEGSLPVFSESGDVTPEPTRVTPQEKTPRRSKRSQKDRPF